MVTKPKTRGLTIRFSEEDWEIIQRLSTARDISAGQLVREAVREYDLFQTVPSAKAKPKRRP